MSLLSTITILSWAFAALSATPIEEQRASCTITSLSEVSSVVKSCINIVVAISRIPGGQALELDLRPGSHVTFRGTTTCEYHEWEGPIILIKGDKITVEGESGSKFDGKGDLYWDGYGEEKKQKPKLFRLEATGKSVFRNLNLLNCPIGCVSIQNSNYVLLGGWTLDNHAGHRLAKNTDGFGIRSTRNLVIENSVVENQDVCVVVNQGKNMLFRNLTCIGSHGLTVEVGYSQTSFEINEASDITFEDSFLRDGLTGININANTGVGPGSIRNITVRNIRLSGITLFGIHATQDFGNEGHPASNIPTTDVVVDNVYGTMSGNSAMAVKILCGTNACSNWKWSNINIKGGHLRNICNYQPSGYHC